MTEEEIKIATTLYTQFDTDNPSGHGLGLSITNNIIMFLGGTLNITSEKSKGTNIEMILPK